jgi:hypothetical protein
VSENLLFPFHGNGNLCVKELLSYFGGSCTGSSMGGVTSWPKAHPLESSCVAFLDFKVEHLGSLSTPPVTAHTLSGALVVDVCVKSDAITDNDARKFKTREQWVMPELRD